MEEIKKTRKRERMKDRGEINYRQGSLVNQYNWAVNNVI